MTRLGRRHTAVVLVWLLLLASCGTPPAADSASSQARIVSLVPSVTEMLFAIGAGPDVVAVSSFDRFPPEVQDLPRVGALVDPDFERILSLRPTLVVVYGSQEDLVARLASADIPVYQYVHDTEDGLADVTRSMRALGARLGRREAAEHQADRIEQELEAIRRRVAGRTRPGTAVVFGREPGALRGVYVSGGVGFLHDILEAAGGRNVFADIRREGVQASAEMLLVRRPEVIIELRTTPSAGTLEEELAVWSRLAAVPAVRTGRIHILTDPAMAVPGPRIVEAVRAFARILHGDERRGS